MPWVQQQYDLIDVLFANAGLMHYEPLDQITSATCDAIIDTNVKGTFFTIQRALPFLRRGASIIVKRLDRAPGGHQRRCVVRREQGSGSRDGAKLLIRVGAATDSRQRHQSGPHCQDRHP